MLASTGQKRHDGLRPIADILGGWHHVKMDTAKWPLVALLFFVSALSLFGVYQKLRDGEVGWKFNNFVSQRKGRDKLGFWLSVGFNVFVAAVAVAAALQIISDRIVVT